MPKVIRCGSHATGGVSAAATKSSAWSRPRPARSTISERRSLARPRRDEVVTIRLAQERGHDVAPRVEIGGHDHQLPESRLSEALGEHFGVATSDAARVGFLTGPPPRMSCPQRSRKRVSRTLASRARRAIATTPPAVRPTRAHGPDRRNMALRPHDERQEMRGEAERARSRTAILRATIGIPQ